VTAPPTQTSAPTETVPVDPTATTVPTTTTTSTTTTTTTLVPPIPGTITDLNTTVPRGVVDPTWPVPTIDPERYTVGSC